MKTRPVGAELFHAADIHDEANSRFSQVSERALKKKTKIYAFIGIRYRGFSN